MSMGGGSGDSAKLAAQQTQQQQEQTNATVAQINAAYGSNARQQQYTDFANNLQKYYQTQINNQQTVANQALKFSLARSGLTGGSAASYAGGVEAKDYQTALLNAQNQTQTAVGNLKQSDVTAKNNLTSLAEQGLSTGDAASNAASAMSANLQNASSAETPNALGTLFNNTGSIYQAQQTAAANRKAAQAGVGGVYAPVSGQPVVN
jgi:hypothetical protein